MKHGLDRRELFGAVLVSLCAGCASEPAAPAREPRVVKTRGQARERLEALARRYESLMNEHGRHEWRRYAGKLEEGPAASAAMARLRAGEREVFFEADEILKRFGDGLITRRRATLWRRGALGLRLLADPRCAELSDRLEATINGHDFTLDGKKVTRSEIAEMRRSPDPRVRRSTRKLENQLHERAKPIALELLRRRRDLAKELGQTSFYRAMLEVRGANPDATDRLLGELGVRTRRGFFRTLGDLRPARGLRILTPWDVEFAVKSVAQPPDERFPAASALDSVFGLYRRFGIDLGRPKLDVTVRDFAFGGQTISLRIPDDVRLVVRPMPGIRFYGLLMHELGHAYAGTRTRAVEPLYKGYEWIPALSDPAFAEGIAETFGRLLDEPRILTEHFGLSAEEAKRVIWMRKMETQIGIRRGLVASAFERIAHEQPDANLDQISLDIERQLGGFPLPNDAEPTWAGSAFLATYPAYTQSYQLAAMMAHQVREALKARFGDDWISPRSGDWLTERLVGDGTRYTLSEKLIRTTGAELDNAALLRFLVVP